MYLAPCKKAKGLEIYFSCNHCIMLAYFCQFRDSDKLLQKFILVTIFEHMVVNFKELLLERSICCSTWKPIFVMLHIEKINLEPNYMPKYDLVS